MVEGGWFLTESNGWFSYLLKCLKVSTWCLLDLVGSICDRFFQNLRSQSSCLYTVNGLILIPEHFGEGIWNEITLPETNIAHENPHVSL